MEVNQTNSKIVIQPLNNTESKKEENLIPDPHKDKDTVKISSEAKALYNGGGHPDRPSKP